MTENTLSAVDGIGTKREVDLGFQADIDDLEELATADVEVVAAIDRVGEERAKSWIAQASAMLADDERDDEVEDDDVEEAVDEDDDNGGEVKAGIEDMNVLIASHSEDLPDYLDDFESDQDFQDQMDDLTVDERSRMYELAALVDEAVAASPFDPVSVLTSSTYDVWPVVKVWVEYCARVHGEDIEFKLAEPDYTNLPSQHYTADGDFEPPQGFWSNFFDSHEQNVCTTANAAVFLHEGYHVYNTTKYLRRQERPREIYTHIEESSVSDETLQGVAAEMGDEDADLSNGRNLSLAEMTANADRVEHTRAQIESELDGEETDWTVSRAHTVDARHDHNDSEFFESPGDGRTHTGYDSDRREYSSGV